MVARAAGIACLLSLGACATETLHHRAETLAADSPFQRNFNASLGRACDAARMVLLGQVYVLAANVPDNPSALVGSKEFKDRDERFSVLQVHSPAAPCRVVVRRCSRAHWKRATGC